jgi:hypothetical protein
LLSINATSQSEFIYSPDSLFNKGNIAFNQEKYDEAIYYYEKAKLLDPRADDIGINLQLANEKLSTDIIHLEPFFLSSWWRKIVNFMLPGNWKLTAIFLLLLLLGLIYFHLFKGKIKSQLVFRTTAGFIFLIFIIAVCAGITRGNHIFNSPIGIVFGKTQSLFKGPDIVSDKVKTITGGDKIKILDEDGEWFKVSAMDSEQGWIKKQNVKLIKF